MVLHRGWQVEAALASPVTLKQQRSAPQSALFVQASTAPWHCPPFAMH